MIRLEGGKLFTLDPAVIAYCNQLYTNYQCKLM